MGFYKLARIERKVTIVFVLFAFLLDLFAQLVVQLFLIIEEHEFVFEDLRVSHL
jgi:hypothetical protein